MTFAAVQDLYSCYHIDQDPPFPSLNSNVLCILLWGGHRPVLITTPDGPLILFDSLVASEDPSTVAKYSHNGFPSFTPIWRPNI